MEYETSSIDELGGAIIDALDLKREGMGLSDRQFARFLGIGVVTWWQVKHSKIPIREKTYCVTLYRFPELAPLVLTYLGLRGKEIVEGGAK